MLKLVAEGKSNKEVAPSLGISVKTAMSHREHLMEKLGLHSRTELIHFAIREGSSDSTPRTRPGAGGGEDRGEKG